MGADAARVAWMQEAAPGVAIVAAADRAAAVREAADADVIIGECVPEVIAAGPRIRWVQRMYAGVERCVAIPAFAERGIVLTNMQKVAGPVMAEHVLAFMFGLTRGLRELHAGAGEGRVGRRGRAREPDVGGEGPHDARRRPRRHRHRGREARARARHDRDRDAQFRHGRAGLRRRGRPRRTSCCAFAARADVIVSTLPLTPETKGLMNKAFFDAAKRGALFINVGRGGTVVTDDLVAALKDGRLGGAGLDVTDPEPLPADHPLWHAPNVIITPHVAAALEGNEVPRWLLARENLRRYVAGGKLLSEVDVKKGY